MAVDEIKTDIKNFILEEFSPEDTQLPEDESLFDAGIIDSLGMIKLTAFIEEKYSIVINPSEVTMDNFSTIDKIAKYIGDKA